MTADCDYLSMVHEHDRDLSFLGGLVVDSMFSVTISSVRMRDFARCFGIFGVTDMVIWMHCWQFYGGCLFPPLSLFLILNHPLPLLLSSTISVLQKDVT